MNGSWYTGIDLKDWRMWRKLGAIYIIGSLSIMLVWGLIYPVIDQTIRNYVDEWMSEREIFENIALTKEDYENLDTRWREVIAGAEISENKESKEIRELVINLSRTDIELIDTIAGMWLGQTGTAFISTRESGLADPRVIGKRTRLIEIGVMRPNIIGRTDKVMIAEGVFQVTITGETAGVQISPRPETEGWVEHKNHAYELTDAGGKLLRRLGRATDLAYICRIAAGIRTNEKLEAKPIVWIKGWERKAIPITDQGCKELTDRSP